MDFLIKNYDLTQRREDAKIIKWLNLGGFAAWREHGCLHLRIGKTVYDAYDGVFHQVSAKVQQISQTKSFEFQIDQDLFGMDFGNLFDRLGVRLLPVTVFPWPVLSRIGG